MGGIVTDSAGRLLLVLRGREPAKGCWSVPGGRKQDGESDVAATAREVFEETGLRVVVGALVGTVERDSPDGSVYVIHDYRCAPRAGIDPDVVRPCDDAEDVGWFTAEQVRDLQCSPGLPETLEQWGVLPPADA